VPGRPRGSMLGPRGWECVARPASQEGGRRLDRGAGSNAASTSDTGAAGGPF